MKIIGLTGGISTGKSTVSQYLLDQGYTVLDADGTNHRLMEPGGPIYDHLLDHFGPRILTDSKEAGHAPIDRKKLGAYIFKNDQARAELNKISHPLIYGDLKKQIEDLEDEDVKAGLVFVDIPLLFETEEESKKLNFDKIILVDTSEETQIKRLQDRDQITRDKAALKIQAQMPLAEKRAKADYIIRNEGSRTDLYDKIEKTLIKLYE